MIAKFIAVAALAASLIATPAAAQTAAELLQKGIYTRKPAAMRRRHPDLSPGHRFSGVPRAVAAQAQAHVVGALLQNGRPGRRWPAIRRTGAGLRGPGEHGEFHGEATARHRRKRPRPGSGQFPNGRYRHYWTGVELTLAAGLGLQDPEAPAGRWRCSGFGGSGSKPVVAFVWMKYEKNPLAHIADRLLERMQHKLAYDAALPTAISLTAYARNGFQRRTVGGQQALSALADYVNANGEKMTEYVMIAQSEKTRVFFCARAAPRLPKRADPV